MNWKIQLLDLKDKAELLLYEEDSSQIDFINRKISLYSEKIFEDRNRYGLEAENILYQLFIDPCPEAEQRKVWEQGKRSLINLIEIMIN